MTRQESIRQAVRLEAIKHPLWTKKAIFEELAENQFRISAETIRQIYYGMGAYREKGK